MYRKEKKMSQKLYVGGLSWDTDENGLKEVFAPFGDIEEAIIIKDRETDRSRGFGFVSFTESEAASKAIEKINGTELDGRVLTVNEARDRNSRGGGRGNRGGGGRGGNRGW